MKLSQATIDELEHKKNIAEDEITINPWPEEVEEWCGVKKSIDNVLSAGTTEALGKESEAQKELENSINIIQSNLDSLTSGIRAQGIDYTSTDKEIKETRKELAAIRKDLTAARKYSY